MRIYFSMIKVKNKTKTIIKIFIYYKWNIKNSEKIHINKTY
jgi:hypothetical protein